MGQRPFHRIKTNLIPHVMTALNHFTKDAQQWRQFTKSQGMANSDKEYLNTHIEAFCQIEMHEILAKRKTIKMLLTTTL